MSSANSVGSCNRGGYLLMPSLKVHTAIHQYNRARMVSSNGDHSCLSSGLRPRASRCLNWLGVQLGVQTASLRSVLAPPRINGNDIDLDHGHLCVAFRHKENRRTMVMRMRRVNSVITAAPGISPHRCSSSRLRLKWQSVVPRRVLALSTSRAI